MPEIVQLCRRQLRENYFIIIQVKPVDFFVEFVHKTSKFRQELIWGTAAILVIILEVRYGFREAGVLLIP